MRNAFTFFERVFTVLAIVALCSTFLPITRFYGSDTGNPGESDPANLLAMVSVLIFSLVMLLVHLRRMGPAVATAWLPWLVVLIAFASAVWSVTPDITLRRAANFTGTTLFGVYLAARWRPSELARLLVAAGLLMAIASIGLLAVSPGKAIMAGGTVDGSLRGAFSHKNMLGWMSGLILIACGWTIGRGRRRKLAIVTLLLTVPLWLAARSMTAVGAVVVTALVCMAVTGLRYGPRARIVWGYLMLVGGTLSLFVLTFGGAALFKALGRDASFTGRAPVWDQLFKAIGQSPAVGYGFQSFWQPELGWAQRIASDVGWVVPTAHNGWIDVWLALGLIGLVPVAFLILNNLWRASVSAAEGKLPGAGLILAFNVYFLVISFFESNLAVPGIISWALHVASAVYLAKHFRVRARARARRAHFVWQMPTRRGRLAPAP
jgi:O-antigen ligase